MAYKHMGWWPFNKKRVFQSDPYIRGSKMWIQDLRELCERNFNDHDEGQLGVEEMRLEWRKSHSEGEVSESLLDGLERRALLLLEAGESEWTSILDNEEFWKAGWGSKVDE